MSDARPDPAPRGAARRRAGAARPAGLAERIVAAATAAAQQPRAAAPAAPPIPGTTGAADGCGGRCWSASGRWAWR